MDSIGDLLSKYTLKKEESRKTERGEFLKYFSEKIGKPIGYVAMRLKGIPTSDLYVLKKNCDSYNGDWSKAWYGQLKVREK